MIDRIDAKLLDLLQRTGPRPAAELGDIVGLSASACHRRIRALEAAGIITGYSARLDPERIGLGLDVFAQCRRFRPIAPPLPLAPARRRGDA